MQHLSVTNKYDPNLIIQAARETATGGTGDGGTSNTEDIGRGQMIYQQALLDWTDDYREGVVTDPNEIEILQEAITSLWISYAQYLMNAKQYKTATETFEQALLEWPNITKLYLEYARFSEERQKVKTAQDIYLRALVQNGTGNITDEQDRTLLWNEFLVMMQNKNPELTLEELQHAVAENEQQQRQQHAKNATTTDESDDNLPEGERQTKRFKNDPDVAMITSDPTGNPDTSTVLTITKSHPPVSTTISDTGNKKPVTQNSATSKTHVVLADSIEHEALGLLKRWTRDNFGKDIPVQQLLPGDVMAAWMILDGNEIPTVPEPLLFQATTPKLTDPTGKEIVGIDMAIQLVERLLDPLSGDLVLQLCSALWTIQGLKFVETNDILEKFDTAMFQEYEQLEIILDSRLSSSSSNPTLAAAVQQMNHNERQNFQSNVSTKRIQILTKIAWEFRYILYLQQTILRQLRVPGFNTDDDDDDDNNNNNSNSKQQQSGATAVDTKALQVQANICKYLHSAFYIRSRMGKESHESTLRNQLKRLQKEQQQQSSSLSPKMQSQPTTGSPMPTTMYTNTAYGAPSLPPQHPIETGAPQPPPQYILQPQLGVVSAGAMEYSRQPQPPYGTVPPPNHLPPPPPTYGGYPSVGGYVVPPQQQQQQPGMIVPPPPPHTQQQQYYYPQQQAQQPPLMMQQQQQQQPPQPYVPGYVVPGQSAALYQQQPPPNSQQQQTPQYPYYQQQ